MKRVIPFAFLALALAAGAWLLLTPSAGPVPVGGEGDRGADAGAAEPEKAAAPSLSATAPGRARQRESHRGGGALEGVVRRAGSPVQDSRGPRIATSTPAAASTVAVARAILFERSSKAPAHPTQ